MDFKRLTLLIVPFAVLVMVASTGMAKGRDMGGWGKESPYNRLYDPAEADNFKAVVTEVKEVVPLPGMSPGVALEVREGKHGKGDKILVHLCPVWFADPSEIGIRRGDQVKLKGVWAEIDGKDVFMASKVKKGEYFEFKVRLTKDGTPFWTMDAAQLKKERAASQASLEKR